MQDEYEDFIDNQVFLGMPFDKSMKETQEVIENVCEENGLNVKVLNREIASNSIIEKIQKLIETSEFLIIDLTMENPNVYYELGYADGVGNEGKEILLLAKDGTDLKFDVKHRTVNKYSNSYDLQKKLQEILPKFIEGGRV